MPRALPAVTYDEIWDIACNDNLTVTERNRKLEGCARRIITEACNNAPLAAGKRENIDYRMIEILRAVKHLHTTADHSKC